MSCVLVMSCVRASEASGCCARRRRKPFDASNTPASRRTHRGVPSNTRWDGIEHTVGRHRTHGGMYVHPDVQHVLFRLHSRCFVWNIHSGCTVSHVQFRGYVTLLAGANSSADRFPRTSDVDPARTFRPQLGWSDHTNVSCIHAPREQFTQTQQLNHVCAITTVLVSVSSAHQRSKVRSLVQCLYAQLRIISICYHTPPFV